MGRLAARHRSVGSPWLHYADEVRDGDRSVCVGVYQEGGLDVFYRPHRCVLLDSCPSGISAISSFCLKGCVHQFRALCFGLSTAPQVFTRVLTLVPEWEPRRGMLLLRYLDDWLIIAESRILLLQHQDLAL